MQSPKPIRDLLGQLRKLPGIGPRTAERLTYWLLRAPREQSMLLAAAITRLKEETVECKTCFNIGDSSPCSICTDDQRDSSEIMVVEEPLDLIAIEKTGKYHGLYHVLGGAINPVAGVGPESLRLKELVDRVQKWLTSNKRSSLEIIISTNPSMEGETTAMYIANKIKELKVNQAAETEIRLTRIARGLPTGADVEYADVVTLSRALEGRTEL